MGDSILTGLPAISYTGRDFSSIMEMLRVHLQTKFPNTWRDVYESSPGQAWMQLCAFVFDILSFQLDYMANEGFLPTQQDRENTVKLCKLIGYRLQAPKAAAVTVTLTLPAIYLADVVIPVNAQVTSDNDLTFEFLSGAIIPAGSQTAEATVTQGETKQDTFNSDGTSFQKFLLTGTPVIDDTVEVTVDGEDWTEAESLMYGDATSKIFQVTYDVNEDGDDIAYVEFGDGTSGRIPPTGSTINATYRIGGGIEGNIALNQLNTDVSGSLSGVVPATAVTVAVANDDERGSGGEDRETVQHAKYWAPQWVKTNGRAVTEYDFDVLATRFSDTTYGGLAYAKARLYQEIPELNQISIACWSRDLQGIPCAPSAGLIAAVQDYFDNNGEGAVRLICADTVVEAGTNLWLDISLRYHALTDYKAADVETALRAAVSDLFDSELIQAGLEFKLSYLYSAIQAAEGVDYALVDYIKVGLKQEDTIGTGDGATATFAGTLSTGPVIPDTVVVQAGSQVLTDDGDGNLTGDGVGTIDYDTLAISVTFATFPNAGENVVATSRYLKQYQRGETEETVTAAAARWRGRVTYPPIVPGSFAISDGSQVIYDDGSGNLIGDIDAYGKNTLDYETGAYDATFASAVTVGSTISSTYRQYLNINAGNIPVEKWELAVLGNQFLTQIE